MKKIFLLFIIVTSLSIPFRATANPIYVPPPQVFISELSFNSNVDWTLEMQMYIYSNEPSWLSATTFDSIVIQTNAGRTRLLSFPIATYQLFLVTPANLDNLLTINPVQDTIRVITYVNPSVYLYGSPVNTQTLIYGYSGCEIPVLNIGQSVCTRKAQDHAPLYFYLDNSPTIGAENDTIGATVAVYGHFYDCRDSLITNVFPQYAFSFQNNIEAIQVIYSWYFNALFHFDFDNQGIYHTNLLSRNTSNNKIIYLDYSSCPYGAPQYSILHCAPFSFFNQPGETQYLDIHLTDSSFVVGIESGKHGNLKPLTVICGPNPVDHSGTFYISSDQPVEDASIHIFSLTGQKVMQLEIPRNTKSQLAFTTDQLGKSGVYFYSVIQKGQKVASGQIICK